MRVLVTLALLALTAGPLAAQGLEVPIRVPTGDLRMIRCASSIVAGLDPKGDGFIALRAGPGTGYARIGELHNGDVVYPCDARGDWLGILFAYPKPGQPVGPGGWVERRWVKPLAG